MKTEGILDMTQANRSRMYPFKFAENENSLPWLLSVLCVWQLVLHLIASVFSGDMRLIMPHLVAWLQDILLFGLIAGAGELMVTRCCFSCCLSERARVTSSHISRAHS